MMRLSGTSEYAASQTVRVDDIERHASLAVVRFAFLDEDLFPDYEEQETIQDGIVVVAYDSVFVDSVTEENFPIQEAYLKDYFDAQFGPLISEACALTLVS